MDKTVTLALIAHDQKKDDLVDFCQSHALLLESARIFATGTTGSRVLDALPNLDITRLKSGPLGGDQQIGAMIAEGKIDGLIFFVDPLTPMPHDVDVKALMRLGLVYDIAMALNRHSAQLMLAEMMDRAEGMT